MAAFNQQAEQVPMPDLNDPAGTTATTMATSQTISTGQQTLCVLLPE
jgi:hypothetical protein